MFDIPVSASFSQEILRQEGFVTVQINRGSGKPWISADDAAGIGNFEHLVYDNAGNVIAIRFIYPIFAQNDINPAKNKMPAIQCEARKRFEQKFEFLLHESVPSMIPVARRGTPSKSPNMTEFSFHVEFSKNSVFHDAISFELCRTNQDAESGCKTLTFNITFHPMIGDISEGVYNSISYKIMDFLTK